MKLHDKLNKELHEWIGQQLMLFAANATTSAALMA